MISAGHPAKVPRYLDDNAAKAFMDSSRKRRTSPTIADVAELAGVSRAIASRALSSESRPVSADKRARVLGAAKTLGFKPNLLARSLTTKTVNLIAVIVNHIHVSPTSTCSTF